MSALQHIEVRGFKSIKQADISLSPGVNVLIGPNGSGKSNFLSLFRLINHIGRARLQNFVTESGGADALLYYGRKTTRAIKLKLDFGPNVYEASLAATDDDKLFFSDERCSYLGPGYKDPYVISVGNADLETGLITEMKRNPGRIAEHVYESIASWQVYHFHDTSPSARVKQTGSSADHDFLQPDAANLAAFLLRLRQDFPDDYDTIVKTIKAVAPFFDDFVLRSRKAANGDETIQLRWHERGGGDRIFPASALSDGTLRFICLAVALLQPESLRPASLLIDEPELGLHPAAIVILAELIKMVGQQTQILVSTQSVPLVNQFGPKDLLIVEREQNASTFTRLDESGLQAWLDDYGMGDLWEKNLLGGRPKW